MPRIEIDLDIGADDYLLHYRVPGVFVQTRARDGRRIRFPARLLQPFVGHSGVRGRFVIEYDEGGRCQSVRRIDGG